MDEATRCFLCSSLFLLSAAPPHRLRSPDAPFADTTIAEGYDPNGNYVGITAMQVAVENANADMFLVLLKFGADPKKKTASRSRGTYKYPKFFLFRAHVHAHNAKPK